MGVGGNLRVEFWRWGERCGEGLPRPMSGLNDDEESALSPGSLSRGSAKAHKQLSSPHPLIRSGRFEALRL